MHSQPARRRKSDPLPGSRSKAKTKSARLNSRQAVPKNLAVADQHEVGGRPKTKRKRKRTRSAKQLLRRAEWAKRRELRKLSAERQAKQPVAAQPSPLVPLEKASVPLGKAAVLLGKTSHRLGPGQWPVIIVGAGPTGLTLSTLLSKFGVPSLLLERNRALPSHPQAHYINNRSMEVFRQIPDGSKKGGGSLAEKITAASPPLEQWRKSVYCQSLTGPTFGEVDLFEGQETALAPDVSPEAATHLSQNRLLPMLFNSATGYRKVGKVAFGDDLKSFCPGADGSIDLHVDSPEGPFSLSCKYLVAADGASSGIRRALGVKMLGQPALQHLINIHFSAPELARRLLSEWPASLYFVFNPQAVVTVVAHDLDAGEFVARV